MLATFCCAHCKRLSCKEAGAINRAERDGLRLFCDRRCAGLARRKHKTKAQRVAEKAAYDQEYKRKNLARIKARRAAYFKATYDPDKARIERKKRAKAHAEYCRRPEYKAWKRWYDANYRAKEYGEFADAYRHLLSLNREINQRITDYEKRQQNQTLNKSQDRKRSGQAERTHSRQGRGSQCRRGASAYG